MSFVRALRADVPPPAPARLPAPWLLALIVIAATVLQMTRRSGPPAPGESLFAEDGGVFVTEALSNTFPSPLLDSYVGYLHVVPRLIAEVTSVLPIEWAAATMALLATLCVSVLGVFVYVTTAAWIESAAIRGGLAAAFVLLPSSAYELTGVSANLHWYLLFATFCALAYPARSRRAIVACSAVALLTALSDPLAALTLPAALVSAIAVRGSRIVAASLLAGLAVQALARTGEVEPGGESSLTDLPGLLAERVATSLAIGDRWVPQTGVAVSWALLVLVAAACALALVATSGRRRALVVLSIATALTLFCVPLMLRGTEPLEVHLAGARYVYPPVMLLLTALAVGLDRFVAGAPRRTILLGAAGTWLATVLVANYGVTHAGQGGPHWKAELDAARTRCAGLPQGIPRVVDVPVTPGPPWAVRLSCDRLE